jgi:hypothetical protein
MLAFLRILASKRTLAGVPAVPSYFALWIVSIFFTIYTTTPQMQNLRPTGDFPVV